MNNADWAASANLRRFPIFLSLAHGREAVVVDLKCLVLVSIVHTARAFRRLKKTNLVAPLRTCRPKTDDIEFKCPICELTKLNVSTNVGQVTTTRNNGFGITDRNQHGGHFRICKDAVKTCERTNVAVCLGTGFAVSTTLTVV